MRGRIDKGRGALLAIAFALIVAGLPARQARAGVLDSPGCLAGGAPAVVASVDDALDLHLTDGRIVRLAGVDVPETRPAAVANLGAWLTHVPVAVVPLRAEPDRWGRTIALAYAAPPADPDRPVSVTEALLEAGQVAARPDPVVASCWDTELRLEREARQAGRGLWAVSPVLAPADAAGLQARAGSLALVAGRIGAVRDSLSRVYLRFADDRGTGMAVTLPLPFARKLAKAGMDPHGWVGRRLRVRGLLDDRWGWQIEVSTAQQLEIDPP